MKLVRIKKLDADDVSFNKWVVNKRLKAESVGNYIDIDVNAQGALHLSLWPPVREGGYDRGGASAAKDKLIRGIKFLDSVKTECLKKFPDIKVIW